ncbi:hypothetical protein [Clostridium perfringens]|uniref:hypothetical protein n=1 Tax=Clostridium perfringens TaxID=1502 RepID=UPI0039E8C721
MREKLIYITLEGINSTVFNSQVYELLDSEISEKYNVELLCLQPINIRWNKDVLKKIALLKKNRKFKITLIPYIGFKNMFSYNIAKYILNIFLKVKYNNSEKKIIHCRAQEASLIISEFDENKYNFKLISDIRGAQYEELKDTNLSRAIHFKKIEDRIFNKKNLSFNFVSNKLFEHYNLKYNITNNYNIIPCFGSFIYNNNNKIYGEKENISYIYIGGQQFYQKLDQYYKILRKTEDKSTWIFCLNGNKNLDFEEKIKVEANKKNINLNILYNLSKSELKQIYLKADVGVIYRDNLELNRVASPVKIAEYLSNGLAVMMIGEIGDFYDEINKDSRLGLAKYNVEDLSENDILHLKGICSEDLQKYRVRKSKEYSKEYCVKKYIEFYEGI